MDYKTKLFFCQAFQLNPNEIFTIKNEDSLKLSLKNKSKKWQTKVLLSEEYFKIHFDNLYQNAKKIISSSDISENEKKDILPDIAFVSSIKNKSYFTLSYRIRKEGIIKYNLTLFVDINQHGILRIHSKFK